MARSTVSLLRSPTPRLALCGLAPRPTALRLSTLTPRREPSREGLLLKASRNSGPTDDEPSLVERLAAPVAALTLCALLSGAVLPEEALAARSGGRMGGSSFRSRAPSMPRGGGGGYRQYNYYGSPGIAPPLVGGYGYGMGGYGLMPSFFFPVGFGGIFNLFIALFVINFVINTVQKFQQRRDDEDDFDDM